MSFVLGTMKLTFEPGGIEKNRGFVAFIVAANDDDDEDDDDINMKKEEISCC